MPLYVSQCRICQEEIEYISSIADRHKTPAHCGKKTKRVFTNSHVIGVFEAYKAVGLPGQPWISTRQEHKSMLRRFNKEEVGNDSSVAPPKMDRGEFEHQRKEQLKELSRDMGEINRVRKRLGIET